MPAVLHFMNIAYQPFDLQNVLCWALANPPSDDNIDALLSTIA